MAAYPSIALKHTKRPALGRDIDVSVAGTIRGVDVGRATVYRIIIEHPLVNQADRDILLSFYDTNKNVNNTITLGGTDYSVQFTSDYEEQSEGSSFYNLSVTMVGVKV